MSRPIAIAAVTETLRSLIAAGGVVPDVTALPPDQAPNPGARRINLFLYHIGVNAALRNQEFPWQGRGGGDSQKNPPAFMLPLQLYYMVTAFADDDIQGHEALGHAMRVLHDNAQLTSQQIKDAVTAAALDSDLADQPEKVKVTLQPASTDEMTKIWTAFQSPYRLSVSYEVSVTLIDSDKPSFSPLPVLNRGKDDTGVFASAGSSLPFIAALKQATGPRAFNTGFVGDKLVIEGANFNADSMVLLRRILDPSQLGVWVTPDSFTSESITVTLPMVDAAGPFAIAVLAPDPVSPPAPPVNPPANLDHWWRSNELNLGIAPKITAALGVAGALDITVAVSPNVLAGQRVALLIDGTERSATINFATPAAPIFTIDPLAAPVLPSASKHGVRLRVDGVDLPGIVFDAQGKMSFETGKELTIP